MPTAARTYVTAGVALVGAGVISATPIATPQQLRTASFEVGLVAATQTCTTDASALCQEPASPTAVTPITSTADSTNVFNIPANLFIALANTPYNFFTALGEGNVEYGSEPNSEFSFQPTFEGVTLTQPEGSVAGLGRNLRYTGSWWLYSQTNILGTDPADPSRYQAITNILVPFPALSVPLGNMFAAVAASQLPMDVGCTGTGVGSCDHPEAILSKMFDLRHIVDLFSPQGYTFPETRAGITCSEDGQCYVKDEDGPEVPWSGENVKLDASAPFTSFYNSLTKTPEAGDFKPVTPELVTGSLTSLANGVNTAFNPFVLGTQCAICAPFVPNPENEPVPGPVFEDPDTGASPTVASPTVVSATVAESTDTDTVEETPAAESDVTATSTAAGKAPASSGPKHRKPTATSETLKNVRESINSTISKVTDGLKKPSSTSGDKSGSSSESKKPSSAADKSEASSESKKSSTTGGEKSGSDKGSSGSGGAKD